MSAPVENQEVGFSVNGRRFCGIRRLGFSEGGSFIIEAWTTPAPAPRGSYFTAVPISSAEYRKRHPTLASFRVPSPDQLVVYDDWGNATTIAAPPDIIAALEAECAAAIPTTPPTAQPPPPASQE